MPRVIHSSVAYREGAEWLACVKEYIEENLSYLRGYLAENLTDVRLIEPEEPILHGWISAASDLPEPR